MNAILSENTSNVNLGDALTPAEKAFLCIPQSAATGQEFHRQLFSRSSETIGERIKIITRRDVRETTAEIETATSTIAHTFKSGATEQVFLVTAEADLDEGTDHESTERDEDDGFHPWATSRVPSEW